MNESEEQIKQLLSLIVSSSHDMPDYVFCYCKEHKKKSEEMVFYNLIADSFLNLFSFCLLIKEGAFSQAYNLLRTGIEQVSAVYLLAYCPETLPKYIDLFRMKAFYSRISSKDERVAFLKEHQIPRNRVNEFFDYSWVSILEKNGEYGRNQMISLAHLDEFLIDIEQTLNAFSHGSLSAFAMLHPNTDVFRRYWRRACLTCCKLFDFLCCSYHKLVGDDEFSKLPLNEAFCAFKEPYLDFLEKD